MFQSCNLPSVCLRTSFLRRSTTPWERSLWNMPSPPMPIFLPWTMASTHSGLPWPVWRLLQATTNTPRSRNWWRRISSYHTAMRIRSACSRWWTKSAPVEHRADLAQDTVAALLSVKVNSRVDPQRFEPSRNELGKAKSATMEYNRLHVHDVTCSFVEPSLDELKYHRLH